MTQQVLARHKLAFPKTAQTRPGSSCSPYGIAVPVTSPVIPVLSAISSKGHAAAISKPRLPGGYRSTTLSPALRCPLSHRTDAILSAFLCSWRHVAVHTVVPLKGDKSALNRAWHNTSVSAGKPLQTCLLVSVYSSKLSLPTGCWHPMSHLFTTMEKRDGVRAALENSTSQAVSSGLPAPEPCQNVFKKDTPLKDTGTSGTYKQAQF